jgi:Zn-dependent protease with chaperone function
MSAAAPVSDAPSLRRRALLAVALTVTFYVLAIAIAVALIAGPIALWASSGTGNIWVTIAAAGAGLAILRAIIPERDRFEPSGPQLRREDQPRLHALLDAVAADVGQPPADAVHVDLPVNASVVEHRGRRIMMLGLPLLATLDEDELRAVVAHEYGHYAGGDTRFSGWIWRTRVAVLKTVDRLASSDSWFRRSVVRWPFEWYAKLFLRITNAISRRQEFAADALAARTASPDAAGRALRRLEAVSPAFDGFWQADVVPMLDSGRRPQIASGFAAMTRHTELAGALDEVVRSDLDGTEPDPYASHPTLRQRLEALGVPVDAAAPAPAERPAVGLLDDLPELERKLLVDRFGDELAGFDAAGWDEAADVHVERIGAAGEQYLGAFPAGLTVGDAGEAATELASRRGALRAILLEQDEDDLSDEAADGVLIDVLAGAVVVAARRAGATVTAPPGEPVRIRHGDAVLDPWDLLVPIAVGEAGADAWRDRPRGRVDRVSAARRRRDRGGLAPEGHDEVAPAAALAAAGRAAHGADAERGEPARQDRLAVDRAAHPLAHDVGRRGVVASAATAEDLTEAPAAAAAPKPDFFMRETSDPRRGEWWPRKR